MTKQQVIEILESYKPSDNIYNGYDSIEEKVDDKICFLIDEIIERIKYEPENGKMTNYCPECGAYMKAEVEDDGKTYKNRNGEDCGSGGGCEDSGSCEAGGDQRAKEDSGKLRLELVPREIIRNIAAVREYGTRKYKDPENWRRVEEERFRNAAFRHFLAFLDEPEGADEESGLPHLWHLACNIAFLCEKEKERGGAAVWSRKLKEN